MNKYTAIVLAAGSGKRMESNVKKQYMMLGGKPLMVHCLEAFERSAITSIILVVAPGEIPTAESILTKYNIKKVEAIVEGGDERYDSVYAGLKQIDGGYVMIHDAARPFIEIDVIHRCMSAVALYEAAVVGMPSKDTIKITDDKGKVLSTPLRQNTWVVQTPQCFTYELVKEAYDKMMAAKDNSITDDAMVIERYTEQPVHMIKANYENIKITTPSDIQVGEAILMARQPSIYDI